VISNSNFLRLGAVALALIVALAAITTRAQVDVAASTLPSSPTSAEADALASAICKNTAEWRDRTRHWLRQSYPDRAETTARAVQRLQTIAAHKGCPAQSISDFVGLAKVETCVIYPIDSICLRKFVVPKHAHAFDLQPQGGSIYPGMRAVVPGDGRVIGGVGVKYNDALPASGDAISGLTGFRTPVADGVWRVILVSGKRPLAEARATPFGASFMANGQKLEVMTIGPDRWIPRGAFSNLPAGEAFTPFLVLPGSAPAIVFDVTVTGGELILEFPEGAELSIAYVEPADQPTSFVLDGAPTVGTQTPDGCLAQQEALDLVANQLKLDAAASAAVDSAQDAALCGRQLRRTCDEKLNVIEGGADRTASEFRCYARIPVSIVASRQGALVSFRDLNYTSLGCIILKMRYRSVCWEN
jgi:hypothetical protein